MRPRNLDGTPDGGCDSGQATLEAALSLPIVLIALLLIVQTGIVVRDVLALQQAAREGVREAAVGADDGRARDAVRRSAGPLDAERIEIEIVPPAGERRTGDPVAIDLRYVDRLSIPIVSRIVSLDLPLHATAAMRSESSAATGDP
jgi:hypothetical protein